MAFISSHLRNLTKCSSLILGQNSRRSIKRYVAPTLMEIRRREKLAQPLPIEKTKRSQFLEWNYNAEIYAFGKRLGEEFQIELLLQSFIHRSYIVKEELKQQQLGIDNPNLTLEDNDLLAKEGTKIIAVYIEKFLSDRLPRLPQEAILSIRDYLLSDEILGKISKDLGTTEIIMSADYPVEEATYAKTFKAIVGALAQSQSVERADRFVHDFVLTQLAEVDLNELFVIEDPLKVLTELLTRDGRSAPEPRLIGQSAMNDILAAYTVGLYSKKELIGVGPGETVNIAVEMAARDGLKRLFQSKDSSTPLRFDFYEPKVKRKNLTLSEWRESAFENVLQ